MQYKPAHRIRSLLIDINRIRSVSMTFGKVKQNITVLAASNLIIGLIEFVFNMYLARILGAQGLGLLSLSLPVIYDRGHRRHHVENLRKTRALQQLYRNESDCKNCHLCQLFLVCFSCWYRFNHRKAYRLRFSW